ncbi:D-alanine--D-alanine ligase family protein [Streptomyces sp. SP17KL33]|uniref:D-alanine--D-alanine ligase family protein n=1 Tax=Streptomyces sp. SP17KL33 TaxID=3002534 RepID=UPI002E79DF8F|nr:D-alanine--D-alanine ligase [Streptomyces sp. SP17KL33]MEE1829703.1 D-alanine--D-alanine ligase [Streptomyces sp. SP17KL33]
MYIPPLAPGEFTSPVTVITGGWSLERDRSLLSGRTVNDALTSMGVKTCLVDLDGRSGALLTALDGAQAAFLAIAGRGGEDGRVQGMLETLGVPYTGSGVLASALGMNKRAAKTVVAAAGVRVPSGVPIEVGDDVDREAIRIAELLGLPLMVKPVGEGGSIGLQLARTTAELASLLAASEGELMAEVFHPGRSVSVGVLESDESGTFHVLPPLEAETPNGLYTYAAKRGAAECAYHCPARVSPETMRELQELAVVAHRALRCHSYSRHDVIVTDAGEVIWLEVNTLPGLARTGNLARMAYEDGISYEQLLTHILRGSLTNRRAQS